MVKMINFWGEGCPPCKQMHPIVEELAQTYDVERLNVEEASTMVTEYGIRAVPTFLFLKDGEEVDRVVGAVSKNKLEEILEAYK
jgi:thioredoxin 1